MAEAEKNNEKPVCGCGSGACCTGPAKWIWLVLVVAIAGVLIAKNAGKKESPATGSEVAVAPAAIEKTGPTATPPASAVPVKGLPRLVDLGAGKCIPCKMMAPILEELRKTYAGKMEVTFVDVWEKPDVGKEYGIDLIPTQIFYDAQGKEVFRHEGFFAKEDILAKWKELGVDLPPLATNAPSAGAGT